MSIIVIWPKVKKRTPNLGKGISIGLFKKFDENS